MHSHTGADAFGRNGRFISLSPSLQCGYASVLAKEDAEMGMQTLGTPTAETLLSWWHADRRNVDDNKAVRYECR